MRVMFSLSERGRNGHKRKFAEIRYRNEQKRLAGKSATNKVAAQIKAERVRQKEKLGWSLSHDDEHSTGDLARAAACYADPDFSIESSDYGTAWPWDVRDFKPKSRREDLIRAAALIMAEIERLDRRR